MPGTIESPTVSEARRAMEVCNACRYCEGYCAVFPAMERRREFAAAELTYLANLCHNCMGCYYACQFAPPHEYGINVPRVFAELRQESYAAHAWPGWLAGLYRRNGLVLALATAGASALVLGATLLVDKGEAFRPHPVVPGRDFYDVIPFPAMVWVGTVTFLFSLLALGVGFARFWRTTGGGALLQARPWWQALRDAASLRYLGGGGHGCNDSGERFSSARRHSHHALAYGFLLCLAATTMGTVYDHLLGWPAPYPFLSLPVLLGVAGGIGMLAGCAGLFWLKLAGDQEPRARQLLGAEAGLLALLFLVPATGLLLLALRATGAMGVALAVHLGLVLALFVTLPYSKMVHGVYRLAALVRHAKERTA
ncbi:MAG: tricarballylate utilization 4Fe-4S protein TcuB [Acetobacteraceae bacterium]|nr:tricarballylate utilization 4Fe-4S protein TcuB [Acetobacteraceae bacterium]